MQRTVTEEYSFSGTPAVWNKQPRTSHGRYVDLLSEMKVGDVLTLDHHDELCSRSSCIVRNAAGSLKRKGMSYTVMHSEQWIATVERLK